MLQTPGITSDDIEGTRRGERKRNPCKCFADDGDTHSNKKAKGSVPIANQSSTGSVTSLRKTTSRSADIAARSSPPRAQPHAQPHAPEDASGGTEGTLSESEPIEVNDSDDSVELIEDDDDELGL
jgi:hypothetical protein